MRSACTASLAAQRRCRLRVNASASSPPPKRSWHHRGPRARREGGGTRSRRGRGGRRRKRRRSSDGSVASGRVNRPPWMRADISAARPWSSATHAASSDAGAQPGCTTCEAPDDERVTRGGCGAAGSCLVPPPRAGSRTRGALRGIGTAGEGRGECR
jgi:hypothetical protein